MCALPHHYRLGTGKLSSHKPKPEATVQMDQMTDQTFVETIPSYAAQGNWSQAVKPWRIAGTVSSSAGSEERHGLKICSSTKDASAL